MKVMTRSSFAPAIGTSPVRKMFATLATAWQVARERRALQHLDARTLADIGMSDEAAAQESGRAFWDLPANR